MEQVTTGLECGGHFVGLALILRAGLRVNAKGFGHERVSIADGEYPGIGFTITSRFPDEDLIFKPGGSGLQRSSTGLYPALF
jgi:hypothetical protein